MRFAPKSLGGQMAMLIGLALLVAQLANFGLILNERQKLSLAQNQGPAITRFASIADDLSDARPEFRAALIADASHRGARFEYRPDSGIEAGARDRDLEARLRSELGAAGLHVAAVRATIGDVTDRDVAGSRRTPAVANGAPDAAGAGSARGAVSGVAGGGAGGVTGGNTGGVTGGVTSERRSREGRRRDMQIIRLAYTDGGSSWLAARFYAPRRDPWLAARLGAATILLYLLVLGATVWIALRITRPLRSLTQAATAFGGRTAPVAVTASGPSDLRQAIDAFNAMNRRVEALLDEKDRMLGAIGHDLRTPLASLRIRVETMEPEEERDAAIAKISEMTAMLEDILVLARTGRARDDMRPIDVAALADTVVEEFRALGQPVTFEPGARSVVRAQPDLLRRALRNLIENAVVYGGSARVSVHRDAADVRIAVVDEGPGIPASAHGDVLQPFFRLENSRNRATGGSGLGLAIADSIAANHGGRLALRATEPHGLTATIILPVDQG